MDELITVYARNVRNKRQELDMSQEEFGSLVGISTQTVSAIENCKHFPSYKKLVKISEVLKVHPARLLIGDSEILTVEDTDLKYILVETFKNLTPKQRDLALKFTRFIAEEDV